MYSSRLTIFGKDTAQLLHRAAYFTWCTASSQLPSLDLPCLDPLLPQSLLQVSPRLWPCKCWCAPELGLQRLPPLSVPVPLVTWLQMTAKCPKLPSAPVLAGPLHGKPGSETGWLACISTYTSNRHIMLSLSKHKCGFPSQTTPLQSLASLNSGSTLSRVKATHPDHLWLLSLSHPTGNPSRNALYALSSKCIRMWCSHPPWSHTVAAALILLDHRLSSPKRLWVHSPLPLLPCSRNTWPLNRASNAIACDSRGEFKKPKGE